MIYSLLGSVSSSKIIGGGGGGGGGREEASPPSRILQKCVLLNRSLTPDVYNGKFSNVNNEFNATNVRSENFPFIFHNQSVFAACHRFLTVFT